LINTSFTKQAKFKQKEMLFYLKGLVITTNQWKMLQTKFS